ncbi:Rhodanese-like domain-containing protein [Syncephalis fuscata]|nr:Rhodanese-like domain-containing protein [Syncephalis fuscata]
MLRRLAVCIRYSRQQKYQWLQRSRLAIDLCHNQTRPTSSFGYSINCFHDSKINSNSISHQTTVMTVSNSTIYDSVEYIEGEDLASILRDPTLTPRVDYVVIDVRDDDFEGGNIISAINVPSHRLMERLPELIKEYGHVPKIIFHCALSQVRGPTSAGIYHQAVLQAITNKSPSIASSHDSNDNDSIESIKSQQVFVLRGGFALWQARYKDTTDLMENYNRELWESEYM